MPYARLDDTFYDHPKTRKVLKTEPAAGLFYLMAIAYCSRHDTDGAIPSEIMDYWISLTPFRGKRKQEVFNSLFELELFEHQSDENLVVVGYLDYQLSSEERRRKREARRENGRRGGLAKAANRLANTTSSRLANTRNGGLANGSSKRSSLTEPNQTYREEANASPLSSDASRADTRATEEDRRLCGLLKQRAVAHNPKFKVKSYSRWLTDMRLLRDRDNNSPQEIEQALAWVFSEQSRDGNFWWADVIQSPGNLREHFSTIWAKMRSTTLQPVAAVEGVDSFLARRGVA